MLKSLVSIVIDPPRRIMRRFDRMLLMCYTVPHRLNESELNAFMYKEQFKGLFHIFPVRHFYIGRDNKIYANNEVKYITYAVRGTFYGFCPFSCSDTIEEALSSFRVFMKGVWRRTKNEDGFFDIIASLNYGAGPCVSASTLREIDECIEIYGDLYREEMDSIIDETRPPIIKRFKAVKKARVQE